MKKLLLFATLCVFAFDTKAQELNFEETVKYIKDKMECCLQFSKKIEIKKNGLILLTYDNGKNITFNLFDLYKGEREYPRVNIRDEDEGYGFGYNKANNGIFFMLSTRNDIDIRFNTEDDNLRVIKAFRQLLKVCTKEKDPFDK